MALWIFIFVSALAVFGILCWLANIVDPQDGEHDARPRK